MSDIDYDDLVLEELNYNSYLKVPQLLELQQLISKPAHHDEMFFIIIHQTAELWFKEILHETSLVVGALRENVVSKTMKALNRIKAILNLQIQQIRLLGTLTPVEFAGFRDMLRPASGFQSAQFREIEFTYGVRNPFFLRFFEDMPEVAARLSKIQHAPSVWDECVRCMNRIFGQIPKEILERDVTQPWEVNEPLKARIKEIYESPRDNYHWVLLFEVLTDVDEHYMLWKKTHALMVERTIGRQSGTGGSTGYQFLRSRENVCFFPELWEVRNIIGGVSSTT